MTITTKSYSSLIKNTKAVALLLSQDNLKTVRLPAVLKRTLLPLIKREYFKAETGKVRFIPEARGPLEFVVLGGLGKIKELDINKFNSSFKTVIRESQKNGIKSLNVYLTDELTNKFGASSMGETTASAAHLAAYNYEKFKTKDKSKTKLNKITFILQNEKNIKEFQQGVIRGEIIGKSINLTRDYGNSPPNEITPSVLANWARDTVKQTKQKVTVLREKDMKRLKMGGILGVSRGSQEEAKFIVLEHMKGSKKEKPIVLVGKGITFDSGGISIKPSRAMDEMKFDMSGGGAVIGIMHAIGLLKLPVNVIGLIPASENVPSGTAYKPSDILTLGDGTTIEVLDTDAEGRIILADALIYARKYKPRTIIDLATLTGAITVALGDFAAGLFSNNDSLNKDLLTASKSVGEKLWPMPLPEEYAERMKSKVADWRNISSKHGGGAITAAKFLETFITKTAWAHLDIAGTAWLTAESNEQEQGATGSGIKTIVEYLTNISRS